MKSIQLAHLYKDKTFYGYGIAVDGELLTNQTHVSIVTKPDELPILKVEFYLDTKAIENPISINLSKSREIHGEGEG